MTAKKSGALAHLSNYADFESESESADLEDSPINENNSTDGTDNINAPESMDSQQIGTHEHDEESQEQKLKQKEIPTFRPVSPTTFHITLQDIQSPDEIKIPPPPPGQPPAELVEKITKLHRKMVQGIDMKASMQSRKDFRNPSIYEKLIVFCDIDELGTNYPKNIYDPHRWGPEAYYDELANRQKEEMDKKEKERKEKTKVEFVTGTAKRNHNENETRKKSKWDVSSSSSAVPTTTISSATNVTITSAKTTITSKVGALIPGSNIRPSLVASNSNPSVPTVASTVGIIKPQIFTIKGTK